MASRLRECFRSAALIGSCALVLASPVAAQQGWSGVITDLIAPAPHSGATPQLAMDRDGNAVAVWGAYGPIRAAHFSAATRTWSAAQVLDPETSEDLRVVMSPDGDAVATWHHYLGGLFVARFSAASGVWKRAGLSGRGAWSVEVAIANSGEATVLWVSYEILSNDRLRGVHAARYDASSDTWKVEDLAWSTLPGPPDEYWTTSRVIVDESGFVTAVWNAWVGDTSVLQATRHAPGAGAWEAVTDISVPSGKMALGWLVVDATRTVTALWWAQVPNDTQWIVQAARYAPGAGAWEPVTDISVPSGRIGFMSVVVDAAGTVTALWWAQAPNDTQSILQAARYNVTSGAWSAPAVVSASGGSFLRVQRALSGTVVAVWISSSGTLSAAVLEPETETWSPVATLASSLLSQDLGLIVDREGNAIVTWNTNLQSSVHASRRRAATGAWSAAIPIAGAENGTSIRPLGLTADPAGNAIAYWIRVPNPTPDATTLGTIETARWSISSEAWSAATIISDGNGASAAFDAAGNALLVWVTPFTIRATEWRATPNAPRIAGVAIAAGSLAVDVEPPMTAEAFFAATNYEYSIDDGASWTARSPASTLSILLIGGLTSGVTYPVRLRGINVAGTGLSSSTAWSTPGPAPGAPGGVTATVAGGIVTVQWTAPVYSVPATGYVLEGGLTPGAVAARLFAGPAQTQLSFPAPAVSFYVRVHTMSGAERSRPSNEIRVHVTEPGPPADLTATVTADVVTLAWTAPRNSVAPTHYVVEGGVSPGSVAATLITPDATPRVTVVVPYGAYYVRVRAVTGAVHGAASTEIPVGVLLPAPPAPQNLLGLANGSMLVLSWWNADGGGPTTGLVLSVTGAIETTLAIPMGESFIFEGVPPGGYQFTLTAVNATTASAPSNRRSLHFPTTHWCDVPDHPGDIRSNLDGNVLTLTWDALRSGAAVTGYVVRVSGDLVGTFPTTIRSLSGAVSPGSYTVSLVATNPCGASEPSDPQTIVVP